MNLTFPPIVPSNKALAGIQFVTSFGQVIASNPTFGEGPMKMLFLISIISSSCPFPFEWKEISDDSQSHKS